MTTSDGETGRLPARCRYNRNGGRLQSSPRPVADHGIEMRCSQKHQYGEDDGGPAKRRSQCQGGLSAENGNGQERDNDSRATILRSGSANGPWDAAPATATAIVRL